MKHQLHDCKIIGDGNQHHLIIDGKDVEGVLEASLNIKPDEPAQLLVKADVKVDSIELKAEVKKIQNNLMNFGRALEELKQGTKVARECWNGKGMYVYYVPAASYKSCTENAKKEFGDMVPYEPYLAIKNVKGTISTWVPSINDCLAEDWEVAE